MSGAAVAVDDVVDDVKVNRTTILREPPTSTLDVARMSVEKQCEYADIVCINGTSDPVFASSALKDIFKFEPLEQTFHRWNATSIGNFAYMSVHVANSLDRASFRHVLDRYIRWRESREFRFWVCAGIGTAAFLLTVLFFRAW